MDFGSLLDYAKKNEKPNKEVKCYRTSFAPPKKEPKGKCLSQNIQKFLARKEEEERKKLTETNKKRDDLLALRAQDSKANKRVRAMLKSTKAANKAAIDDARDDVNTAVTMAGPSQPDEDDYGYVSQEASAFYNKLMDKYISTPSNEPNFSKKILSVKDISSTKDRVRMALLKEEEEESMPHKRKRRKKEEIKGKVDDDDANIQYGAPDRNVSERDSACSSSIQEKPEPPVKKKKPAAPPPMDFAQLLKVAAQKQFEPIKIEKKDKNDEDDRPMTKKQREEYLREKQYRQRKEEMARIAAAKSKEKKQQPSSSQVQADVSETRDNCSTKTAPVIPRIPKLNGNKPVSESQTRVSGYDSDMQAKRNSLPQQMSSRDGNISKPRQPEAGRQNSLKPPSSSAREQEMRPVEARKSSIQGNSKSKDFPREERKPLPVQNVPLSNDRRPSVEDKKPHISQLSKPVIKEERRQINQPSKPVIKEEKRPTINQSLKTVIKEEKRPTINQPLKTVIKEGKRPTINQPLKTVIKEEKRPTSNQSLKPVIKEEKRPTSNQSLKPVIKEEKKQMSQAPRLTVKEEKKMLPPESSRIPPKLGKPTNAPVSKPSQPSQQSSGSSKPSLNPSRKMDEKTSKNSPAGRIHPAGSMLKDRLTSSNNQSLPQKSNNPSLNQPVKKEVRVDVPSKVQSSSSSPSVRPTMPKEIANRPPASRPQMVGSQGTSRDGMRGNPPDRRPLPPKGEMRRPPSMYDRGPPGGRGFPPHLHRPMHPQDAKRRPPSKRRIESDDEYDSELDDFIDDGPEESEDYSKYIKEIFGYDKSRYRAIDYEDEDECMESNYAQQMKEEFVSTKQGIMEDLEDIKKEQMEKKRKKMSTTKKKKI